MRKALKTSLLLLILTLMIVSVISPEMPKVNALSLLPSYTVGSGNGMTTDGFNTQRPIIRFSNGSLFTVWGFLNWMDSAISNDGGVTWTNTTDFFDLAFGDGASSTYFGGINLAVDSLNNVHLVSLVSYHVSGIGGFSFPIYKEWENTTKIWQAYENITKPSGESSFTVESLPMVAVDDNDNLHIVLVGFSRNIWYYFVSNSGVWADPVQVNTETFLDFGTTESSIGTFCAPSIAIGPNNFVNIVFTDSLTTSESRLYYYNATTAYQAISFTGTQLSDPAPYLFGSEIATAPNGTLAVSFYSETDIHDATTQRERLIINNGTAWENSIELFDSSGSSQNTLISLGFDSSSNLYVLCDSYPDEFLLCRTDNFAYTQLFAQLFGKQHIRYSLFPSFNRIQSTTVDVLFTTSGGGYLEFIPITSFVPDKWFLNPLFHDANGNTITSPITFQLYKEGVALSYSWGSSTLKGDHGYEMRPRFHNVFLPYDYYSQNLDDFGNTTYALSYPDFINITQGYLVRQASGSIIINSSSTTVLNFTYYGNEDATILVDAPSPPLEVLLNGTAFTSYTYDTGNKFLNMDCPEALDLFHIEFSVTDWTMFRHDLAHTGYSMSTGPATNRTLWNYTAGGQVVSSPAVVGGVVYIGSYDGNIYALNATTGLKIWNYTTGNQVGCSPAVANGVVYFGSYDNNVYALNATTGLKIWNYTTGNWVFSSTVANGVVYVGSWNNVYALNATTGLKIWNYTAGTFAGGFVYSSPAVIGGRVYFSSYDKNVYALNATTGIKVWNYTTGDTVYSSPAVANGTVYVGSDDDKVYALNATTGALKWNYTAGSYVDSSPAIAFGMVYVGSFDGKVYALNATNGNLVWNYTTGGPVNSSPAIAGNNLVYFGSDESQHNVYALNATTGVLVWDYTTGDWVDSSPAVVNGVVYFGSNDDHVYAFGSGTLIALTAYVSPATVSLNIGESQTFSCTASYGSSPYSYQWYLDGTAVGTNSPSYAYIATQVATVTIWCNVTDSTPLTVKSNIAHITAQFPPFSFFPIGQPSLATAPPSSPSSPSLFQSQPIIFWLIITAIVLAGAGALVIFIIYEEK